MDEISNKTLATLLVVAIVISLAGTFFAMRGTQVMQKTIMTGYAASDSGVAKVNITETISVTLWNNNTVDFGEGYRNPATVNVASHCNLTTDDMNNGTGVPTCWTNESEYNPIDFVLNNNGNVDVNVTINSTTGPEFIYGTWLGGIQPIYNWMGEHSEQDGCRDTNLTTTETTFDNTRQTLCTNFTADDSLDDINISILLYVPGGPTGYFSTNVTFLAARNY